jgi:hypothetical protein
MTVPVQWSDQLLNVVDDGSGTQRVVTQVTGWYGSPDVDTGNVDRVLTDGAVLGPMVVKAREITVEGAAVGPRAGLMAFRDRLAALCNTRSTTQFQVGDPWLDLTLTASVRASAGLTFAFLSNLAFTYQIVLTAADPRRYEATWRQATLVLGGTAPAGRKAPRRYRWTYGGAQLPSQGLLINQGDVDAPVYAVYTGPLGESRLTDGTSTIHVAALQAGEQLTIDTSTLTATAPGGVSRAGYILSGSSPMTVPASSQATWTLQGSGTGKVQLNWRSAWI